MKSFILSLVLFCYCTIAIGQPTPKVVHVWKGDVSVDKQKLHLEIDFISDASFPWTVQINYSENSSTSYQAINDTIFPNILLKDYYSPSNSIKGNVSADSSKIVGTISLNGTTTPITLVTAKQSDMYPDGTMSGSTDVAIDTSNNTNFPDPAMSSDISRSDQTNKIKPLPYILWASFWLLFSITMWLLFRRKPDKNSRSTDPQNVSLSDDWLSKVLPIVRIDIERVMFRGERCLVLYNDSLALFRKRKNASIAALHEEDSKQHLTKHNGLRQKQIIPLTAIDKIEVQKESRLGKVRFTILHNNTTDRFVLPGYDTPNLISALQKLLGNKVETEHAIRFHNYGVWVKTALFSLLIVFVLNSYGWMFSKLGDMPASLSSSIFKIVVLIIAALVFLIGVIFTLFSLLFVSIPNWISDHRARKFLESSVTKPKVDLSKRKQFRSVPVAIGLKILAIAMLVGAYFLSIKTSHLSAQTTPGSSEDGFMPGPFPGFSVVLSILLFLKNAAPVYLIMGFILNLSLALSNKNPFKTDKNDKRKPILYLRSFLDDRDTTLQPGTRLSSWLGVDPPYYQLNRYRFASYTKSFRLKKLLLRYLYNHHPVRILRLMFGWPADTSEQQLELYFRKKGQFTAIGKPGERIVTVGASRMFVSNEVWQDVVFDYLDKSQLVVLQPSSTEGVWWEVDQCLKKVEPERLLMCLVNYKGQQNLYENFRLRMEGLKPGIKFPRFIGNEKKVYFFRFDEQWIPQLLRLKYKPFVVWPFSGNAPDLQSTLQFYK